MSSVIFLSYDTSHCPTWGHHSASHINQKQKNMGSDGRAADAVYSLDASLDSITKFVRTVNMTVPDG